MAQLNREAIKHLSRLCRIQCNEEEEEALLADLSKILEYFTELEEIQTADVPPCNQVLEGMVNVAREDVVGEVLPREDFLKLAPSHTGGYIRVPTVIKKNRAES